MTAWAETRRGAVVRYVAVATGTSLLAARPLLTASHGQTAPRLLALFGCLMAISLVRRETLLPARDRAAFTVVMGALAIGAGRMAFGVSSRPSTLGVAMTVNVVAAVAEESFFRGLVYSLVDDVAGPLAAVALSSVVFALVHVPVYGWWVAPLDLAAGVLFSWQRWTTGTWTVPAVTHGLANALAVL